MAKPYVGGQVLTYLCKVYRHSFQSCAPALRLALPTELSGGDSVLGRLRTVWHAPCYPPYQDMPVGGREASDLRI